MWVCLFASRIKNVRAEVTLNPECSVFFASSLGRKKKHFGGSVFEDHFDARQGVHSVSDFEFVILLGHGKSPNLSNESRDKLDVTARLLVYCESRIDKCVRQCNPPTDCVRRWRWCALCWHWLRQESSDGAGARFCAPLPPSPHFSAACPEKTGRISEYNFFSPFWGELS
jgi:hypothetical protein